MKIDDINTNSIIFLNILYFQGSKLSSLGLEPRTPSYAILPTLRVNALLLKLDIINIQTKY